MCSRDVEKSIFIIGSGRSGTTILYNILAAHPELTWFSTISNDHPGSRSWLRFQKLLDRALGSYMQKRIIEPTRFSPYLTYLLQPNEGENIYTSYCGFDDDRRMTEDDYDAGVERKLKDLIIMHLQISGKRRFINKRTANTQRLRLINKMFPDAYYIHMIRDGRAVINSYLNVDWWDDTTLWWLGEKVSDCKRQGKDPVELAAKHWRRNFEEISTNKGIFRNYIEIRYESFIKDPRKEIMRITDFSNLSCPDNFKKLVPENLPDRNYKWQEGLTDKQISIVMENTHDVLEKLGYAN
jgi:hypothetical protein